MYRPDEYVRKIKESRTYLGIELGSTRIKAVLIDDEHVPVASGSFLWESRLENGYWTYAMEDVWKGIQACFKELSEDVRGKYGVPLETVGAMGISGMMHGYLPFDAGGALLAPFRTWRNTTTSSASGELTELFKYNIPQRWSIAHLYQAILNGEEHVKDIAHLTTLAGYVHWRLTGKKAVGMGEASGMFPVDPGTGTYSRSMLDKFSALISGKNYPWRIEKILPQAMAAGEIAGTLTEEGARLLDPSGILRQGIPLCPPEGDACTGMVATNSVREHTGNVSAGTSVFSMIILETELSGVYPEIDLISTPEGKSAAMVHCNNCSTDIDAWVNLLQEFTASAGIHMDKAEIYDAFYNSAGGGEADCGGLLSYNYLAGEHVTGFDEGRPLFVRTPESRFTFSNFSRMNICSAFASLRAGMDILTKKEKVGLKLITGHGGLFKSGGTAQKILSAALETPVAVLSTAGEGGPWGMAILAAYMINKERPSTLADYLDAHVFQNAEKSVVLPDPLEAEGYNQFMSAYMRGLPVEKAAIDSI